MRNRNKIPNQNLTKLKDDSGSRVWWGEFWEHDVTIAQEPGQKSFTLYIDCKFKNYFARWQDAQSFAVKQCREI